MTGKTKKVKEPEKVNNPKEIVIKETEDDVVFGNGFNGDPEEFKDEIKKEAEKNAIFTRFIIPFLVFIVMGLAVAAATWYYAKPENANVPTSEDKIQTPPDALDESQTELTDPTPTPTPVPTTTPSSTEQTYTVQEGDTMSAVANKYGLTSQELASYNNITDVNTLRIGQVLKIPVK